MFLLDIIGLISFTISGFIKSLNKNLDILGIINISIITAVGGGVIRDLLTNNKPFTFSSYYPLSIALITVFILLLFFKNIKDNSFYFNFSDAIGLSVFSLTGTLIGIENNYNVFGIIFLGTITAVGGGIIRDILINEVPNIFRNDFYASIAIIISIITFMANYFEILNELVSYLIIVFGVSLRFVALKYNWRIPKIQS